MNLQINEFLNEIRQKLQEFLHQSDQTIEFIVQRTIDDLEKTYQND